jgi:hypothetical protein
MINRLSQEQEYILQALSVPGGKYLPLAEIVPRSGIIPEEALLHLKRLEDAKLVARWGGGAVDHHWIRTSKGNDYVVPLLRNGDAEATTREYRDLPKIEEAILDCLSKRAIFCNDAEITAYVRARRDVSVLHEVNLPEIIGKLGRLESMGFIRCNDTASGKLWLIKQPGYEYFKERGSASNP